MLRTPEVLTRRFGISPNHGHGRAVPRVLTAFQGVHPPAPGKTGPRANKAKFDFLATAIPMIVSGAQPEDGGRRRGAKQIAQYELAGMCGLRRRETFTRRVSQFAPVAPSSRRIHDRNPAHIIKRRRQFAEPNFYEWMLPSRLHSFWVIDRDTDKTQQRCQSRERADQVRDDLNRSASRERYVVEQHLLPGVCRKCAGTGCDQHGEVCSKCDGAAGDRFHAPAVDYLAAQPGTGRLWNAGWSFSEGFKNVPAWIWDAALEDPDRPGVALGDAERVVMTIYVMCGLLDEDAAGKVRGEIHPHQAFVALASGLSIKSVYLANKKWERLGIIRVAHPKPTVQGDKFVRGPAKIIYLPIRTLTSDEATAERDRIKRALTGVRDAQARDRAAAIHEELLCAWQGNEHTLLAFWHLYVKELLAAGVNRAQARALVPRPPD